MGCCGRWLNRREAETERIWEQVRRSPVVHADETGWRENGHNGYIWSFSTPQERCFLYGRRTKDMVERGAGPDFAGVLVTDFYAAYDHYPGEHQRCWAHLLRGIHDLQQKYPQDITVEPVGAPHPPALPDGESGTGRWGGGTGATGAHSARGRGTVRAGPGAPRRVLSKRVVDYLKELFVFVVNPQVPPDNNAAERGIRPLVTGRKVSGGTRSAEGTATKMTLATLFGTWHVRGLNPFLRCRQMLTSPQP